MLSFNTSGTRTHTINSTHSGKRESCVGAGCMVSPPPTAPFRCPRPAEVAEHLPAMFARKQASQAQPFRLVAVLFVRVCTELSHIDARSLKEAAKKMKQCAAQQRCVGCAKNPRRRKLSYHTSSHGCFAQAQRQPLVCRASVHPCTRVHRRALNTPAPPQCPCYLATTPLGPRAGTRCGRKPKQKNSHTRNSASVIR